jgi:predicted Ser/Thr protein kinase
MPLDDDPTVEIDGEAPRLFAAYLKRLEDEEEISFESFAAAHPEQEKGLRVLYSLHRQTMELVSSASFAQLVERELGEHLDTPVCLDVGTGAPPGDPDGPLSIGSAAGRKRYSVRGELGKGGMGVVLKVWDEDLNRPLAMKVLRKDGNRSPQAGPAGMPRAELARFLMEAQVTGQLDHPGIVPVHEIGIDADGQIFFTMQLVRGRELREIFQLARRGEEGWSQTRAVGVLIRVCEALAYAHSKGVIHRDVKPANVMVGRFGETYVMDWGLARVLRRKDVHDLRVKPPADATGSVVTTRRGEAADSDPENTPGDRLRAFDVAL